MHRLKDSIRWLAVGVVSLTIDTAAVSFFIKAIRFLRTGLSLVSCIKHVIVHHQPHKLFIHSFIHCTTHILHHPFKTVIALSGMSLNSIFECGLLCRGRRQVTVSRLGHLHTSISCSVMKFPLSSFRDRSDALSRSRRHCDFSNDPAPSSTSSRLGQSRVKKGVDSY